MSEQFLAVVLHEIEGKTVASIESPTVDDLPDGDVLVAVEWSTLNYKDGLAITGAGKIVRHFPFVPGIDFAGRVLRSSSPDFEEGDGVLLTGYGVGERHWGGLAQMARVKGEWLVKLPGDMTGRQAMAIGTAGFTAMLAVRALEHQGVTPDRGEVVVTGAAGGVGSISLPLLARKGYRAVASTGRTSLEDYLRKLGATRVVDRSEFTSQTKAPLASAHWAGAIDTVGAETLAGLLKSMQYHGAVAACGLAGGASLPATVFPFLLRGVRLIGIDSVYCPMEERQAAWQELHKDLDPDLLETMVTEIALDDVPRWAPRFLKGEVRGRLLVRTGAA
ncbi:MAG: oxidoreductase [Geminicoccaceae bacterium]|nr:oxidoreductase [Geminicoccaceae bacterium]MCB9942620.1 oxidoreductase [Geminicoccaceae bacterium]